jgi:hypothetical protein
LGGGPNYKIRTKGIEHVFYGTKNIGLTLISDRSIGYDTEKKKKEKRGGGNRSPFFIR